MIAFLFVGGIVSLVLLFIAWWCVNRLHRVVVLDEGNKMFLRDELIISYKEAVRIGDIALQDQLEALARDYSIELFK